MTEQQLVSFYNKIDSVDTGKRDMSGYEMNAICGRNRGKELDAAVDGFHLGFIKGQRAEQAKEKELCKEDSLRGLRARTLQNVRRLKGTYAVDMVNRIADLLVRGNGVTGSWTDLDAELYVLISNALELYQTDNSKRLHTLNMMARAALGKQVAGGTA